MAELNREKIMENESGVGEVSMAESAPGQARNMDGGEIVEMLDEEGGELEAEVERVWTGEKVQKELAALRDVVGEEKWASVEQILREVVMQGVSIGNVELVLKHAIETAKESFRVTEKEKEVDGVWSSERVQKAMKEVEARIGTKEWSEIKKIVEEEVNKRDVGKMGAVGVEYLVWRTWEKYEKGKQEKWKKQEWEDEIGNNLRKLRNVMIWEGSEGAQKWLKKEGEQVKGVLEEIGREFSGVENGNRAEAVVYWVGKMKNRLEEGGDFQMLVDDLGWWWEKVAMAMEET